MTQPLTLTQSYKTTEQLIALYGEQVKKIHEDMKAGTSIGAEFLGWQSLPHEAPELDKVLKVASKIRKLAEVVVVIGVGGSYLGSKAVKDALAPYFEKNSDDPEILFAGQNLSGTYMKQLLNHLEGKEAAVIVISKSGTTTEPAIAFRILLEYMENRYGASVK